LELALGRLRGGQPTPAGEVSILVFLELALGPLASLARSNSSLVSILVFLELALGPRDARKWEYLL